MATPQQDHEVDWAKVAHDAVSLAWLRGQPVRQVHQPACVCAACEAATQRVRLLDQVNSGQYEGEAD